jgi:hypothetical protein
MNFFPFSAFVRFSGLASVALVAFAISPSVSGQDEIIEEISKLALQGGLEQAVNILAAGRSSAACAVHPLFCTAAPCR